MALLMKVLVLLWAGGDSRSVESWGSIGRTGPTPIPIATPIEAGKNPEPGVPLEFCVAPQEDDTDTVGLHQLADLGPILENIAVHVLRKISW